MRRIVHIALLCLGVLCLFVGDVYALKIPWKQLMQQIDTSDPKAIQHIEKLLLRGQITTKQRAQLLQLKSLIRVLNANTTEAEALFQKAVKFDCQVPLRGNMTAETRSEYLRWKAKYQVQFKCPLPWKELAKEASQTSPKALASIKNYLKAPKLPKRDKAQLLALKALYHRKKGQSDKAQAAYKAAIQSDCQVKLLGELSVSMSKEFEVWGKRYKREAKCPGYIIQRGKPPIRPPAPNRTGGRLTYGILLGLGAAGIVVGAVTSGMAAGEITRLDALSKESPGVGNTQQMRDAFSQAQTMGTVGIISYVGGGALLVAGGIVLFLTETSKPPKKSVSLLKRKEQIAGSILSP